MRYRRVLLALESKVTLVSFEGGSLNIACRRTIIKLGNPLCVAVRACSSHSLTFVAATNVIVIATEKKTSSILIEDDSIEKVSNVCQNIGMVYSGMGPDARLLVSKSRKSAQEYLQMYREYPTALSLVREVAAVMQEYTQSGGVRPFGVSLLVAGFDEHGPSLYQVDPSGSYWAWKASAIGKNMVNAKTFLEKR